MTPIPLISFFADPVPYIGRAGEQRDPLCFAHPQEANCLTVHQVQFLQIQHDLRLALLDLLLQLGYMLRAHPAYEPTSGALPITGLLTLTGHVWPVARCTR